MADIIKGATRGGARKFVKKKTWGMKLFFSELRDLFFFFLVKDFETLKSNRGLG